MTRALHRLGRLLLAVPVLLGCGGAASRSVLPEAPAAAEAPGQPPSPAPVLEPGAEARIAADVAHLAADALEGRATGSPGARAAVDHIEESFRAAGLAPAFGESYRQPFEVTLGGEVTRAEATVRGRHGRVLSHGEHFVVSDGSASGTVRARLVEVGFGIQAPALSHDDYATDAVRGKIALVRVGAPGAADPHVPLSDFSGALYKLRTAREHGAVGVVLVGDAGPLGPETWAVDMGLPAIVTTADTLRPGEELELTVEVTPIRREAYNVAGLVRPGGPAIDEGVIVVGAHHDHLGHGGTASRAPGSEEIHNGADDNASGVALLLETARALAARRADLRRTVVFVAFGAEELGALGSAHYVNHRPAALDRVLAMLNADMVGRLREGRLLAIGAGTATAWTELLQRAERGLGLRIDLTSDGFGASDQMSFAAQRIPVVHFFTGVHGDYHRPEDDAERVDAAGVARITELAARMTIAVANLEEPPTYLETAPTASRPAGGFRVSLGTVPDYGASVRGVRLTGVRPGSPAERAGVLAGDVLVGLAGHELTNIHDYVFALRELEPGREVSLVVDRGGELVELRVIPAPRP